MSARRERLHLPGPDFVDRVMAGTDRSPVVLRNLQHVFDTGRLAGTGYLSILPVDQGVEHSAAASFAPNPDYFDPAKLCELAVEGGWNAIASTLGVLAHDHLWVAAPMPRIVVAPHVAQVERLVEAGRRFVRGGHDKHILQRLPARSQSRGPSPAVVSTAN